METGLSGIRDPVTITLFGNKGCQQVQASCEISVKLGDMILYPTDVGSGGEAADF